MAIYDKLKYEKGKLNNPSPYGESNLIKSKDNN